MGEREAEAEIFDRYHTNLGSDSVSGGWFNDKDVILAVSEIPLWIYDGPKIVLSPQWDFLYW